MKIKIKHKKKFTAAACFAAAILFLLTALLTAPDVNSERASVQGVRYTPLSSENWMAKSLYDDGYFFDTLELNGENVNGSFDFSKGDIIEFKAPDGITGEYSLGVVSRSNDASAADTLFNVSVNGENVVALLQITWMVSENEYRLDRYGNELPCGQITSPNNVFIPLKNQHDPNCSPIKITLSGKSDKIRIENTVQTVIVDGIWLYQPKELKSYTEYLAEYKADDDSSEESIVIQGEDYSLKSDPYIRGVNVNKPYVTPYNTYRRMINVLDGDSWSEAGQKVSWEFDVKKDGWYTVGFRFCQNSAANKASYRDIEIDGAIPFKEMSNVRFEQTSSNKYKNLLLSDREGEPYRIYLSEGRHTIAMTATAAPVIDVYNELLILLDEMNALSLDITKLTAGVSDDNRTWDLDAYLPNAVSDIKDYTQRLSGIYEKLCIIEGTDATYADSLLYAIQQLENLLAEPRTIPNRTELLSSGDDSAVKHISTVISNLTRLSLSIDEIYITGASGEIPEKNISAASLLADSIKKFVYSMTPEAESGSYNANAEGSDALNVWMSRSSVYVQTLQQMIDSSKEFSELPVNISIMPSEQKLILAAASGTNPDVVLGVAYTTPFKFALRGAARDLTSYPDFLSFYNDNYSIQSLVPCCYDDKVYGAVETQDFNVLFYRKDILAALNINVPDTWDDVKKIMPALLRYNKNFSIPVANTAGFKPFSSTSPFIYQKGGSFYAADAASVAFLERETVQGFTELTDLFKIYSLSEYVASFYNSFRSGDCPLGIGGISVYVQLTEAAPELSGLWDIAPAPGTLQSDGSVLRYYNADVTACMILNNTEYPQESWSFLKWWLSADTQKEFADTMESSYGTQYRWNTANKAAFEDSSYPDEHKDVIKLMWESQKETMQHPASYIVEREISNAFNNVTVNDISVIEALEKSTFVSNREIIRKLQEFGFCDQQGNPIKEYPADTVEKLKEQLDMNGGASE